MEEECGVTLHPVRCENIDPKYTIERKQEEYNRCLRDCELAYFIFVSKVGRYTREEFEVADSKFRETGSPQCHVCVIEREEENCEASLFEFLEELEQDYHAPYEKFSDLDALKRQMLIDIWQQISPSRQIPFEDNGVKIFKNCSLRKHEGTDALSMNMENAGEKSWKKKIKIFFASSMEQEESNELDVYIYDLSDKLEKQYGIRIRPIHDVGPEIKEELKSCKMAFFVFFHRLGENVREEFETARNCFEQGNAPKIYTYFKEIPEEHRAEELRKFSEQLSGVFDHYYNNFQNLDTVKLRILLNIKLQEMDYIEVSVKDGMCKIKGQDVLSVENVPEFANSRLNELRAKLKCLEEAYYQMKLIYVKGNADGAFYKKYADVCAERQSLKDSIEELQDNILMQSMNQLWQRLIVVWDFYMAI